MKGLTYRDAGVDIDAGERLVDRIKPLAAATRTPHVIGGIGGFAGLCGLPSDIEDPILVSGTDGVGTKLKLAFALDRHDTVGIDLVAMCVNDVLTVGARPLFFLDYFATGKLDVDQGEAVVRGIADGCKQAGCALLGGETAELPGFYAGGEYDLAGFAVGVVGRKKLITGERITVGDIVLGVASSGLHSNGFSLARRALLDREAPLSLTDTPAGLSAPLGETLLRPTKIYAQVAQAALSAGDVRGFCHITGGGLPGNLHRGLPAGVGMHVKLGSWPRPAIFDLIQREGGVAEPEMQRTFNLGLGFTIIVPRADVEAVTAALLAVGEPAYEVGVIVASDATGEARVQVD
ncbi:MAG: phosphoribosylformylglycinamidine cyclo-ligase [Sandaracinaceae bacterium]|nr:phosphoribosylformylglycinamidine cyclo-ligase [Sandaracinaceae bacterium]MBK8408541.1 phosphoribosylformylglycinamidine cyclo-ligase [Sandaracinaceae bacterium]MBK8590880.1 phosphoribosylformylglycinamidine cyclo-ligase [Sandaracinaceae bacterium]